MEIEYTMDGQTGTRFMLTVRSKENMYRKIVDEDDFSSIHVPLEDLVKLLRKEQLGVSGLSTTVNFMELFQEQKLKVDIELCFQKSERMKRMTESFTISLPKINRDMQLEEITKLKNENSALRRENKRITKKLRAMETFGFFPYYNQDIVSIQSKRTKSVSSSEGQQHYQGGCQHVSQKTTSSSCYTCHTQFQSLGWSKGYQYIQYDTNENFVTYLTSHPRFKDYISWVQIQHPTSVGNTTATMKFQDSQDKTEYYKSRQYLISGSIDSKYNPYNELKTASEHEKIILERWATFVYTLFDLVNEYNFRGIQLLPGGLCVPHENPGYAMPRIAEQLALPTGYVNEFFTEKYIRNPPTPSDKLFFDPHIGFYKCSLYDF
jgi:hypothetical protein